jgi:hypothetical protein
MEDVLARFWNDLIGRLSGPLSLRLLLQPTMATLFAVRDGLKDARAGRPPYFWTIFTDAGARRDLLRDGWKSVGKVFVLALILDAVYQVLVFKWIHPLELVVVAFVLACIPYLLFRGPASRLASLGSGSGRAQSR